MAFEAGDYGRDEDETLAEARERSGRAAGVGSGGNGTARTAVAAKLASSAI